MSNDISDLGSALRNLATSVKGNFGIPDSELSAVINDFAETVGESINGFNNLQSVVEYSQQGIQLLNDYTTGNYWTLATDIASDTAIDLSGVLGGLGGAALGAFSDNPEELLDRLMPTADPVELRH